MPRFALYSILTLLFGELKYKNLFHVVTTLLVLGSALLVAELVTDLGAMFELIGGFSAVGIGTCCKFCCCESSKSHLFHFELKLFQLKFEWKYFIGINCIDFVVKII